MMTQANQDFSSAGKRKQFYDLKQIENIPILDVCSYLGVSVSYRGGKPWCKLRSNEKTPSTLIHTETTSRYKANTFYDFGVHEGGNNISLACMMMGLDRNNDRDRYQAIAHLAEAFQIPPLGHEAAYGGNLTNSQYEKIGLYGDLATKNFSFDTVHMDLERIREISEKYAMPMNQLKKEHPHTFERLLKKISIPLIEEYRNNLYMAIWVGRETTRSAQIDRHLISQLQEYTDDIQHLQELDDILSRAIIGTKLKGIQNREYDPEIILQKIDAGDIKPKFGSRTFRQMQRLAKKHQTVIKYRPLDACSMYFYGAEALGDMPYSVFLDSGKAMIGYLDKDYEVLRPVLKQFAWSDQSKLEEKLQKAEHQVEQEKMAQESLLTTERFR